MWLDATTTYICYFEIYPTVSDFSIQEELVAQKQRLLWKDRNPSQTFKTPWEKYNFGFAGYHSSSYLLKVNYIFS